MASGWAANVRGVGRLAFDGIEQLTHLVEAMHANIAAAPPPLGPGAEGRTSGVTGLVYECIRSVNGGVRTAFDLGLGWLPAGDDATEPRSKATRAILNGVLGDHLAATSNPLAIPMRLRTRGEPRGRVLLLIHGLCMDERGWRRNGHEHGEALARDVGVEPVHVVYNTGRRVAENGRELALRLEDLLAERDVELAILAHSMGGLVARAACHLGAEAGHAWLARLRRLVFLGTPHHGAPLERGGRWLELALGTSPYTAPIARLGRLRSAGIMDLRHGSVRDAGVRAATPLPAGVECHALAGGRDLLVPVASALGLHRDPERTLAFPEAHRWVGDGLGHFDLLDDAAVYARLREIMRPAARRRGRRRRAAS